MSWNTLDIVGKTFGRLTVLRRAKRRSDKWGQSLWDCRCTCGVELMMRGSVLIRGDAQSCGCLRSERSKEYNARKKRELELQKQSIRRDY